MLIGGLQRTTLIDYPGRVAATVFLIGCNFRCPFCYSRQLVLPDEIKKQLYPPQVFAKQKFGRAGISEKDFFEFLKSRKGLIQGVVICGGEPTIQKDLPNFIKRIKKLGYLVKLDTNGSNPGMLKELIDEKLVDYVAMDIKAPLAQFPISPDSRRDPRRNRDNFQFSKYEVATGAKVDLENIKRSIEILKKGKVNFEFRTTIVPGIHAKEDIVEIAKWIGGKNVKYYLQNFRPEKTLDPKFEKIKPYPEEYLSEIKKSIAPFFEFCQIR